MPEKPRTTGSTTPKAHLQLGQRRVHQDHRAEDQADEPAGGQQAEARHLDLEREEQQPEEDQQQAGVVDRQQQKREEGQQQRQAADDARQDRARGPQLDRQSQHAQAEEQIGDVGMRDRR